MKNLVDDLITFLNTLTFSDTVKDIREAYSKKKPVYPMISVDEINNATRTALVGEERLSNLGYQIDVYSKDMYPRSGRDICRGIVSIVDTNLQSQYGMKRVSYVEIPDPNDTTVFRITLRYTCILDVKTDYMYR